MTRLRFAPSPTGRLHVGNARIALANALFARRAGGRLLLRIDDTDRARSSDELAAAIEQDLLWLGITWDERLRQSDRTERYELAADRLRASGRLYPCFENEDELRVKRDLQLKRGKPPTYDRAALSMTPEQRAAAEAKGKHPYWRFKLSGEIRGWDDAVLGPRTVKLSAVSDPVLIRADGTPLYTLTSIVDDIETGITHVIRGEDHVTNTGVQADIAAALGADPGAMRFGHLPLLTDADGGKLSKRLDSLSLRQLRADGIAPEAVAGYLATLGTGREPKPGDVATLAPSFDLSAFGHAPARFDPAQLAALNRRALQGMSFEAVSARLPHGATEAFWLAIRGNIDLLNEARGWWEVVAGTIVPPVMEGEGAFLQAALATLPEEPWTATVWADWTGALGRETGRRGRALFHPLRLALTGEEHGPEMRLLLPLIGRARAAQRLAIAAV